MLWGVNEKTKDDCFGRLNELTKLLTGKMTFLAFVLLLIFVSACLMQFNIITASFFQMFANKVYFNFYFENKKH